MAANTSPIFGLTPHIGSVLINSTSSYTASAGTGIIGTQIFNAFTAGSNGSFIQKVRFMTVAYTSSYSSVASTLRLFYSTTGSGTGSISNTYLLGELSVPAISVSSTVNATNFYDYPVNFAIPSGSYLHVAQHLSQSVATGSWWNALVIGSDY
jgi:hypothetical protein